MALARQHATPLLIRSDGTPPLPLTPLSLSGGASAVSEAEIQALIHENPSCLPIQEIDPLFAGPVPVCTELNTLAGPIDNLMVTPSGLPIIVECKLWRNPEGRREVVGQILDYAKELSRWSSSDLAREVSKRLKPKESSIVDLVRATGHEVDEIEFNDNLTINLRRGRFLLLIVGDGIREGVEAIAEYLQTHAELHFTLGLVELPIFEAPNGDRIVMPRILARTHVIRREVVAIPDGYRLVDQEAQGDSPEPDPTATERTRFWQDFLADLELDDSEQALPRPSKLGYLAFMLPAPGGSSWITVYRDMMRDRVGLFLSCSRDSVGHAALKRLAEELDDLRKELGEGIHIRNDGPRPLIEESRQFAPLGAEAQRTQAIVWLRERTNAFVNAFRPRVRSIADDIAGDA